MNALTQQFPTAVLIDGEAVEINTDFRVGLKLMAALEDSELTEEEKLEVLVRLIYPVPPANIPAAVKQGMKFLNLGETPESKNQPKVYDFELDSKYIYTAFKSSYNIDLNTVEYMHWWQFRLLFTDLGECFFSHLVGIRSRMHTGDLMEHEKKFVAKNKEIVQMKKSEDKSAAADFIANIGKGRKNE